MIFENMRRALVLLISTTLLSSGFVQLSWGGTIDTGYLIETDQRTTSITRVRSLLAQADVADQLQQLGVDQSNIEERLQGMTNAELAALESRIDENIAGSGAIGVIGTVFLVLLILELVGVTDIFKSF